MLPRSLLFRLARRCSSSQIRQKSVERLDTRTLIKISGDDSVEFLQGLITNDMRHFHEGSASMYTLFLNIKGRVMFDSIIYKVQDNKMFYLECDSQVLDSLKKHLSIYKLRKKVEIKALKDEIKVWAVFDPQLTSELQEKNSSKLEGQIFPCGAQYNKSRKIVDQILVYEDPRLRELGLRILAESNLDKKDIVKDLGISEKTDINFRVHRFKLGIGEGVGDFPPGKALPLEINADYLHGVSFHKGCYIGQELTARTHHTGIVRKRIMPLVFEDTSKEYDYDEKICDEKGTVVGKFRGKEGDFGLGLIRIAEALRANSLNIQGNPLKVLKPSWWMPESQKETLLTIDSSE